MAMSSARKNGHELAAAWLRRETRPAQDAFVRIRPSRQPAPDEEAGATSQEVFRCDRNRGFYRS